MRHLLILFIIFSNFQLFSQSGIYNELQGKISSNKVINVSLVEQVNPTNIVQGKKLNQEGEALYFTLDKQISNYILNTKPKVISLDIPFGTQGKYFSLTLFEKEIRSSEARIETSSGRSLPLPRAVFYRGIVNGDPHSLAGICFHEHELSGLISSDTYGTFDIGKLTNSSLYVVYKAAELEDVPQTVCHTDDVLNKVSNDEPSLETRDAGDCVRVWVEADHALFQNKGGVSQTVDYIDGVFNNVSILYDNESISTVIGNYYIWEDPDPYSTDDSGAALDQFTDLRTDLEGKADLAHLFALGGQNIGGLAWIDVLCNSSYFHAYSNIRSTYKDFPVYSWTVEVVTHEMGHNLGSEHTHWCGWQGGALDNCADTEGGCPPGPPPTDGGTIMSYCHLTNYGINFNNGFGPRPGDKIRAKVAAASCLAPCPVDCPEFTVNGTVTDAHCANSNDGKISMDEPTEGIAPYSYSWSNGMSGQTITDLAAGTYLLTITDSQGCSGTGQFTVFAPPAIEYSIFPVNASCFGSNDGSASIFVSGGNPPFTYLWSNGSTSADAVGLAAGHYSVTVTDQENCLIIGQTDISEPDAISSNATIGLVSCHGGTNGFIHTDPTGGSGTYLYSWSNGVNTPDLDNLAAGTYSVTISDANGCMATESFTVSEPTALLLQVHVTNVSQHGKKDGKANATVSGGKPGYNYAWSTGATTSSISNLPAGTYRLTITDSNGCTAVEEFVVSQPDCNLNVGIAKQDITCNGYDNGLAKIDTATLLTPYTIFWSNGANTSFVDSLAPGTYSAIVIDGGGCHDTISVTILEPTQLDLGQVLITDATGPGISDGAINISPSGGMPPYIFVWRQNDTIVGNSEDLNGILSGIYQLSMTDSLGCRIISEAFTVQSKNTGIIKNPLNSIAIYPNPANDHLLLYAPDANVNNLKVELINILGQRINVIEKVEGHIMQMDTKYLAPGTYLVRITLMQNLHIKTILIQH